MFWQKKYDDDDGNDDDKKKPFSLDETPSMRSSADCCSTCQRRKWGYTMFQKNQRRRNEPKIKIWKNRNVSKLWSSPQQSCHDWFFCWRQGAGQFGSWLSSNDHLDWWRWKLCWKLKTLTLDSCERQDIVRLCRSRSPLMIGIGLKDDDYDEGGIDIGIGNVIVMISTGLKYGGGYDIDCYWRCCR